MHHAGAAGHRCLRLFSTVRGRFRATLSRCKQVDLNAAAFDIEGGYVTRLIMLGYRPARRSAMRV